MVDDLERRPLLRQSEDDGDNYDSTDTLKHRSAAAKRTEESASPIVRVLFALRSGHVPDNAQLYALLHATASFCESISRSVIPSTSVYDNKTGKDVSGNVEGASSTETAAPVSDEAAMKMAAMLKECATLSRTSASWLYGGKDGGAGDVKETKDDNEPPASRSGARGNENEQWQRLLWHAGQALSPATDAPVSLDVQGDVQGEARKAAEQARDAAVQVGSDAKAGFEAIFKLIATVLKSDELLRIPSDIVQAVTGSVADVAAEISGRASALEETMRQPPDALEATKGVDEENQVGATTTTNDFVYPKEAVKDAVNKVSGGVEAVISVAPNGKGKERSQDDDGKPQTWEDEAARRAARLLEELKQEEVFRNAADVVLRLTRKYMNIVKEVRDDLDVKATTDTAESAKDAIVETAQKGTEQVREKLSATLASTHFDAEVSAHLSHHATEVLQAAKEVLEGLAGGTSMDTVVERAAAVRESIQSDSELRKWTDEVIDFLTRTLKGEDDGGGKGGDLSVEQQLKQFYARLQQLLSTRPAVVKAWEDLQRSMAEFSDALKSDVFLRRMRARFHHITAMARSALVQSAHDVKNQASHMWSNLLRAALPSLGQVLGNIPLPRVEFTSDKLDAVVDDVHISALDLIPDTVHVSTTNAWTWHRDVASYVATKDSHVDTDVRVHVDGLRLAVKDVSFYVQERFTAPGEDACGGCCSFGHSHSGWCCFRGPASWLSYTESALLDVGFAKKGAGVTIDLRDAGQDMRKKQKQRGWWSWMTGGSNKDDAEVQQQAKLDEIVRHYQDEDETAELKEDEIRTRFFDVIDCQVHVDDTFDFKMRSSRHWIINSMLRLTVRPMVKMLLRRVMAAQIRHAWQEADERAYDVYLRAKLVRHRKMCRAASVAGRPMPVLDDDVWAGIWDYVAVLMDNQAGKSQARLRTEREQQRKEEERARREEDEREEEERKRAATKTMQPKPIKTMEVKPSGVIYHDEDGDYSIAIGVKPEGLLLAPQQHGPKTQRMKVREAIAHPQQTARDAKQYGTEVGRVAKDRLWDSAAGEGDDDGEERDLLDGPRAVARKARHGMNAAQDVVQGLTEGVSHDAHTRDVDEGWKSSAFDL